MVRQFPPFIFERKKRTTSGRDLQFPNGFSGKLLSTEISGLLAELWLTKHEIFVSDNKQRRFGSTSYHIFLLMVLARLGSAGARAIMIFTEIRPLVTLATVTKVTSDPQGSPKSNLRVCIVNCGCKYLTISKIQLVVYYQCCFLIGWATTRLFVIAH